MSPCPHVPRDIKTGPPFRLPPLRSPGLRSARRPRILNGVQGDERILRYALFVSSGLKGKAFKQNAKIIIQDVVLGVDPVTLEGALSLGYFVAGSGFSIPTIEKHLRTLVADGWIEAERMASVPARDGCPAGPGYLFRVRFEEELARRGEVTVEQATAERFAQMKRAGLRTSEDDEPSEGQPPFPEPPPGDEQGGFPEERLHLGERVEAKAISPGVRKAKVKASRAQRHRVRLG
jgi:hypothetical protein